MSGAEWFLEATHPSVFLADAFAVTMAEREQAILVTPDHHEFDPLPAAGSLLVRVRFIR